MLRVMFTLVVGFALLLSSGLWFARQEGLGPSREEVVAWAERARKLAQGADEKLGELERAAKPPPSAAAPSPVAPPEPAAPAPRPVAEPVVEEEVAAEVEEVVVSAQRSRPFIEAPLETPLSEPPVAEAADPPAQDQEEWAHLIRRMLALYEQVAE